MATYADLLALPDHVVGEIVGGELHASPRPAPAHAVAASSVGADLHQPFHRGRGGPGGWWILVEPELHLGEDVMVPDLAGWRRSRLPQMPETPYFERAPDWVCEVLSPSTSRLDRVGKLPRYASAGVGHAWLVEPLAQTLEVYRRVETAWLLIATHGGDTTVHSEPFEAVAVELAVWWDTG
jgi:Uma2 family endonuclease